MNPPKPTDPLSPGKLARDEQGRGTAAERTSRGGDDPHFPASEGAPEDAEEKSRRKAARVESDVTLLPPG